MDPNACLRLIEGARAKSTRACLDACQDLAEWLARGGFEPDWDAYPKGRQRFRHWQTPTRVGKDTRLPPEHDPFHRRPS